ncbi:MAG: hypothetical protein DRI48_05660 [Chloroflexi bacterium]|nr:MAG: hypothetical protein DRI48_05660 [Chloroflexota bacterium]
MNRRFRLMALALIGLMAGILACNAPTPTPPEPSPTATIDVSPTSTPHKTPTPSTVQKSPTPTSPTVTETLTPTEEITPTVQPTPTPPISTGPLDFPVPTALHHWESLPDGRNEATIKLQIIGGAPPYVIHHDLDVFVTWDDTPEITFTAQGCSAIVHTIAVESADGQIARHDYWIPPPWCD